MPEILTDALDRPETPETAAPRSRLLGRLAVGALLAVVGVSLLNEGVTLFIRHSWLRQSITSHLAAAFGRPVEVGDYRFTVWGGPEVVADSVSVAEDPRFGYEYFLRAGSLSARLRWSGLLRGHLVLGRVLLTQPSLNLVRNEAGDWNFAEWLPRPENSRPPGGFLGPVRRSVPGFALNRIEVDGGRVNFKIEDEKLPFALVDVNGYVEPDGPGRWRLDLSAAPLRAPVILQQPGVLRVAGEVGGTSSRLRPASLQFYWTGASVSDLLRLARNDDEGMRGLMNLEIDARTNEETWVLESRANLSELHRWDLPARTDNPSLLVTSIAHLDPAISSLEITNGSIDAPHSHLNFAATLGWSAVDGRGAPARVSAKMRMDSSGIGLNDLLAWLRAFHSDVANDIALQGTARMQLESSGWPPRLDQASVAWDHAVLTGPRLRVPIRLSSGSLEAKPGRLSLASVSLSFGDSDGSLRLEALARPGLRDNAPLEISGQVAHVRDLISSAAAFGWVLSRGWDLEGPLRCDLRWPAGAFPWREHPQGTADWGSATEGASLQTPFLNQPVEGIRVHADWKPGAHSLALAAAGAFGAHWNGSFERREAWPEWRFDLSADRIAAADLDRWLDPRWKQSFLDRLLPFLNPRSPAIIMPENLGASGTISIGQFALSSVVLHKLEGGMSLRGRTIELFDARAQLYGGAASGNFLADLHGAPRYTANVKLARVDLGALEASTQAESSAPRAVTFSGLASGDVTFRAQGTDRAALAASLSCRGAWNIQDPEIHGINLGETLAAGSVRPGASAYRSADAAFSCGNGRVRIPSLKLAGANQELEISGSVDFSRNADLRVQVLPLSKMPQVLSESAEAGAGAAKSFSLTGNLSSLQLRSVSSPVSPK